MTQSPFRKKTPRDFFSLLSWDYDETVRLTKVFSVDELANLPLKWLKYLLLARVGFTSSNELARNIKRFKPEDSKGIIDECAKMLNVAEASHFSSMIVIKIVFFDKAGQLPNHRIYKSSDLSTVNPFISKFLDTANEIWLCESSVSTEGSDFGGRITFPLSDSQLQSNLEKSNLEIVWYSSPRRIEDFQIQGFPFPFLRATKEMYSMCYKVQQLHIPEMYLSKHLNDIKFLKDCQWALTNLFRLKESNERLQKILHGAGAKELSIEFKSSNGKFSVIDWDTEIEAIL